MIYLINPLASPRARAPSLKYGYVNTVTSPFEVKELIQNKLYLYQLIINIIIIYLKISSSSKNLKSTKCEVFQIFRKSIFEYL